MSLYVLDNDHLSLHQRGYEPLRTHLLKISPEKVNITIISIEEIFRGRLAQVRKAQQAESRVKAYFWLSRTLDYLCGFEVLNSDLSPSLPKRQNKTGMEGRDVRS